MAVTRGATTANSPSTANPQEYTHSGATAPEGVLVFIATAATTDVITGVTYGGVAMDEIAAVSPFFKTEGSEDGTLFAYFLDHDIPAGDQTVSVSKTGAVSCWVECMTVQADGPVSIDSTATGDSSGANPSISIAHVAGAFVCSILWSGQNTVTGINAGTGWGLEHRGDLGNQVAGTSTRAFPSAGTDGVNWTAGSEEWGIVAVSIREAPVPQTVNVVAATAAWSARALAPTTGAQAVDLVAPSAAWSARALEPSVEEPGEEPQTVDLVAPSAAWTASALAPAAAAATVPITAATAAWSAGVLTPAGDTVTVAASPASASWSAGTVTASNAATVDLAVVSAAWTARVLVAAVGAATVSAVAATAAWSARAFQPAGAAATANVVAATAAWSARALAPTTGEVPLLLSIVWAGAAGSFGATIAGLTETVNGHPVSTLAVPGATWPDGQGPWFSAIAGDGTLIVPSQPLTTNAFQPTGLDLVVGTWLPLGGAMVFEQVLTTTGQAEPLHQGYGDVVGGADFEGIARVEVGGQERFVLSVGKAWNGWEISVDGLYPTFVVVRKVGDSWVVDYDLSRTAEEVQDSNPAAAAGIYIDTVDPIFSEAFVDSRQALELATLPDSGHVAVMHYDSNPTAGLTGGAISVVDEALDLQAGYLMPNVEWPTGHGLSVRPRGVAACPVLDSDGNEEFAVAYDVFDETDDTLPGGMFINGGLASAADAAAWNVSGVLDVAVKVTLPDYTPGATGHLVAHDDIIGGSRGWSFLLTATGELAFFLSSTGIGSTLLQASAAPGLTDWREYWLGVSYNTATGALAFYKADGAEAMPTRWSGWTLISSHSVTAAVPFNSTAGLTVGMSGGFPVFGITGWVHRAAVWDDGVLIADPNFGPDASPAATVDATTYTDSVGVEWSLVGTASICQAAQSLVQVFSYDGTSVVAKSAGLLMRDYVTNRPTQVRYDENGSLWVTLQFLGLYNGITQVFDRTGDELSCVTAAPATADAWIDGDGSVTNEWAHTVVADLAVPDSAVGATAAGLTWDASREVMVVSTGTTGLIFLGRDGPVEIADYQPDDAPGTNSVGVAVVDPYGFRIWVALRQTYDGSYPPASPPALDQWLVGIQMPGGTTITPAAAAWSASALVPSTGAQTVTLAPAAAAWSARPLAPTVAAGSVSVAPASATWSAAALTPTNPATVDLAAGTAAWTARALTVTGGAATVALVAAAAAWSARAVTVSGQAAAVDLDAATATWSAQPITPSGAPATVEIVAAAAAWTALPFDPEVEGEPEQPQTANLAAASATWSAGPLTATGGLLTASITASVAAWTAAALAPAGTARTAALTAPVATWAARPLVPAGVAVTVSAAPAAAAWSARPLDVSVAATIALAAAGAAWSARQLVAGGEAATAAIVAAVAAWSAAVLDPSVVFVGAPLGGVVVDGGQGSGLVVDGGAAGGVDVDVAGSGGVAVGLGPSGGLGVPGPGVGPGVIVESY